MQRKTVDLGGFTYLVDLYKAKEDMLDEDIHYANFVMLRKYEFVNDIANDKEIFFVEKTLMDTIVSTITNTLSTSLLSFPMRQNNFFQFTSCFKNFSEDIMLENLKEGNEIYPLLSKNGNYIKIMCDKVRIYHPDNQLQQNYIIYFDNWINNIHYHYYCRPYYNLQVHSENIFDLNNKSYSEYFEFYIPNIEDLFSDKVYFKDNLNISEIDDIKQTSDNDLEKLSLLNKPFMVKKDTDINSDTYGRNIKKYINISKSIENNFLTSNLNVTLFPYLETDNYIYAYDEYVLPNTEVFITECRFRLASHLGFSNGNIAVISNFEYPNKNHFISKYGERYALREAYKFYNNVTEEDYENYVLDENTLTDEELEDGEYITSLGFMVEIAADHMFKHVLYKNYADCDTIDDFSFELNNIFTSWDQYPEILLLRVTFVDRYLITNLRSNVVVITKEWFKYMLYNNIAGNRLTCLVDLQSNKEYNNHLLFIEDEDLVEEDEGSDDIYNHHVVSYDDIYLLKTTLYKLGIRNDDPNDFSNDKYYLHSLRFCTEEDINTNQSRYKKNIYLGIYRKIDGKLSLTYRSENYINLSIYNGTSIYLPELILIPENYDLVYFPLDEEIYIGFFSEDLNENTYLYEFKEVPFNLFMMYTSLYGESILYTDENLSTTIDKMETTNIFPIIKIGYRETLVNENYDIYNDMNLENFNFIDKINCVINQTSDSTTIEADSFNLNTSPAIIYKPIFYRTYELQTVKINSDVEQNIGINLANYFTKVDTFKIKFGDYEVSEYARNDIYVIFKILPTSIDNETGRYHIFNQDDEYISSGSYYIVSL